MKIKLVVVDLEVPANVKKWGLRIGIPAVAVLAGGIAWAGLPTFTTWTSGQALAAADLNNNFANLQQQITTASGAGATAFGTRIPSAAHATMSTDNYFAAASANTTTKLPLGTVDYDVLGEISTTNATFTAQNKGLYTVTCSVDWYEAAAGQYVTYIFQQPSGGTAVPVGADTKYHSPGSAPVTATSLTTAVTQVLKVGAGDQIWCEYQNNSAGTVIISQGQAGQGGATYGSGLTVARLY